MLSDDFVELLFIHKSENQWLLKMIMEKRVTASIFKNLNTKQDARSACGFFMTVSTVKNRHKFHILYTQVYINALILLSIQDKVVRQYGITVVSTSWVSIQKENQITTRKAEEKAASFQVKPDKATCCYFPGQYYQQAQMC